MSLPDLPSGVWRHYKGPLYLVLGYGHDANADTLWGEESVKASLQSGEALDPLKERFVVVYVGLQLDEAKPGPRLAVRSVQDFLADVRPDGSVCPGGEACTGCVPRFEYVGGEYQP